MVQDLYIYAVDGTTTKLELERMQQGAETPKLHIVVPEESLCVVDASMLQASSVALHIVVRARSRLQFLWENRNHTMQQKRSIRVSVEADAACVLGFFTQLAGEVHTELVVDLMESGASCYMIALHALYAIAKQKTTVLVRHARSATVSLVRSRDILFDTADSSFKANTILQFGSQGSDGTQEHKALLCSEHAKVQSFPEIEVSSDGVSCTHASAVGQISSDHLAYLLSRALSPAEAKKLLLRAFIMQVQLPCEDAKLYEPYIKNFLRLCGELL